MELWTLDETKPYATQSTTVRLLGRRKQKSSTKSVEQKTEKAYRIPGIILPTLLPNLAYSLPNRKCLSKPKKDNQKQI